MSRSITTVPSGFLSYGLTGNAQGASAEAGSGLGLHVSAGATRVATASCSVGLGLRPHASATRHPAGTVYETVDLGRFRRGDPITIAFTEATTFPDAVPVAALVESTFYVPPARPMTGLFSVTIRQDDDDALGTFSCVVAYTQAGVWITRTFTWTLVAGGDAGGEVVSIYSAEPPEGRHLLAQLATGKLAQGDAAAPYLP